jgi:hypothetical protein
VILKTRPDAGQRRWRASTTWSTAPASASRRTSASRELAAGEWFEQMGGYLTSHPVRAAEEAALAG